MTRDDCTENSVLKGGRLGGGAPMSALPAGYALD